MAYTLWQAGRCFALFAQGHHFSTTAVTHLRGVAVGMFAASVVGAVSPTVLSVALSWGMPPGLGALVMGVTSQALMLLLFAALVWHIAEVMRQAAALAEENAQFV